MLILYYTQFPYFSYSYTVSSFSAFLSFSLCLSLTRTHLNTHISMYTHIKGSSANNTLYNLCIFHWSHHLLTLSPLCKLILFPAMTSRHMFSTVCQMSLIIFQWHINISKSDCILKIKVGVYIEYIPRIVIGFLMYVFLFNPYTCSAR